MINIYNRIGLERKESSMKKTPILISLLGLGLFLNSPLQGTVLAQTETQTLASPSKSVDKKEEMSALRKGLIEVIDLIRQDHPEIVVTDLDIHRHQFTDKYVYRVGATTATYEYEAIYYDGDFSLNSQPIAEDRQATVLELINKRNERLDDRLNCDMVTNLMRKHFKKAKITDWHFDDNRFESPKEPITPIKNQAAETSEEPAEIPEMDIFWIVDLIEGNLKFRVKVDAFTGEFVKLDSYANYEIDTVASRINYYKQFYEGNTTPTDDTIIIETPQPEPPASTSTETTESSSESSTSEPPETESTTESPSETGPETEEPEPDQDKTNNSIQSKERSGPQSLEIETPS